MTKFERDELARLNRAMDQYRDALKRLVDTLAPVVGAELSTDAVHALEAARKLLA